MQRIGTCLKCWAGIYEDEGRIVRECDCFCSISPAKPKEVTLGDITDDEAYLDFWDFHWLDD
jgi:hypothetical protein